MVFANVLFDLDGTLADSAAGIVDSLRHTLRVLGAAELPAETMRSYVGPPMIETLAKLLPTDERAVLQRAYTIYCERYLERGMYQQQLYPGVQECLQRLVGARVRCSVVTSKLEVNAQRVIEHFGLMPYFSAVVGCAADGSLSDKREAVAFALRRYSLDPAETVMVGDRRHDIEGGRDNGLFTIGVTYGYGALGELQAAGADRICATPSAVADLLLAESDALV